MKTQQRLLPLGTHHILFAALFLVFAASAADPFQFPAEWSATGFVRDKHRGHERIFFFKSSAAQNAFLVNEFSAAHGAPDEKKYIYHYASGTKYTVDVPAGLCSAEPMTALPNENIHAYQQSEVESHVQDMGARHRMQVFSYDQDRNSRGKEELLIFASQEGQVLFSGTEEDGKTEYQLELLHGVEEAADATAEDFWDAACDDARFFARSEDVKGGIMQGLFYF